MEPKILDWGKCDWFLPKDFVRRKVYQGSSAVTISMGEISPGHKPGPHSHDYEQTVVILDGKCDFVVGGKTYVIEANFNDEASIVFMTIPANVEHYIHNHYDRPVYNMDIFYPKRTADRKESVEVR